MLPQVAGQSRRRGDAGALADGGGPHAAARTGGHGERGQRLRLLLKFAGTVTAVLEPWLGKVGWAILAWQIWLYHCLDGFKHLLVF